MSREVCRPRRFYLNYLSVHIEKLKGAGNKYEAIPRSCCLRAMIAPYGYSQKRISAIRVGVYTSDSNNWMPRVYVRGYVCAIIGFGRDRVTIVIKSYEAAAGWRSAVALTCRPVISRSTSPGTTCIFVD